ncbi:MAG: hypothetical protein HOO95_02005 [Gallionella sp.]|nr:hypothetical protein [Gallionella sp.]
MFSFLKVFDGKPDHPMFDIVQAKNLLNDLPKQDAFKALSEITSWLVSVKGADGFRPELRAEIFMLLDVTGLPLYEQLLQLYIGEPHLQNFKGFQLWQGLNDYKHALSEAYALSIEEYQLAEVMPLDFKQIMPIVAVRLMLALSEQMQLSMMRYDDVEPAIWLQLCNCYVFTLNAQIAESKIIAYPKLSVQATPHYEFLRAVMLYISSPATLAPDQIAACYRITGHLVNYFDCKLESDEGSTHYIDFVKPSAPKKLEEQLKVVNSMRFFSAAKAVPKIADIVEHHEQAFIQHAERSQNVYMPSGKLTVLKHLQLYWGKNQPSRNQKRQTVTATVEVIHGMGSISQWVAHIDQGNLVNVTAQDSGKTRSPASIQLSSMYSDGEPEIWIVLDVSERGVGGVIPKAVGAWVKIGDLCAIKLEGSPIWWVGMIRRLKIGSDDFMQFGIEILAKKPLAVLLRAQNLNADKGLEWEVGVEMTIRKALRVILLPDSNNSYANATMLMASGNFLLGAVYELMLGEKNRNIKLTGLLEEGGDYERVSFVLLNA